MKKLINIIESSAGALGPGGIVILLMFSVVAVGCQGSAGPYHPPIACIDNYQFVATANDGYQPVGRHFYPVLTPSGHLVQCSQPLPEGYRYAA